MLISAHIEAKKGRWITIIGDVMKKGGMVSYLSVEAMHGDFLFLGPVFDLADTRRLQNAAAGLGGRWVGGDG